MSVHERRYRQRMWFGYLARGIDPQGEGDSDGAFADYMNTNTTSFREI
jgi:hypothetical protein